MYAKRILMHWGWIFSAVVAMGVGYVNPFPFFQMSGQETAGWEVRQAASAHLSDYVADIEAQPIAGLSKNLSGLTYNEYTGTLFGVINRPAALVEISTEGLLLRHQPLPQLKDPEGITHVRDGFFIVSDESDNRLHRIDVADDGTIRVQSCLALDTPRFHNLGIEGVSWDQHNDELLVAHEKWPKRVYGVRGGTPCIDGAASVSVEHEWPVASRFGLPGSDISSLTTDPHSGHFLLVLDELAMLVELNRKGRVVDYLPLWRGFGGLARKVPQAEGIALGASDTLYLVSEPNLFYRFRKQR